MTALTPDVILARLRNRVAKMDTNDLMVWADVAAMGIQRQLDDFRKKPDERHLSEIHLATISMDAVCEELGIRMAQAKKLLDPGRHPG